MSLFSFLIGVVFAAEMIISPLPDNALQPRATANPTVSFGNLMNNTPQAANEVLGASTEITPTPTLTPMPTPTPTPITSHAAKSHYTIALLGDSMIDTLGPDAPQLKDKLHELFPATTFTILNFGVGGTNIDYGLQRLTNAYTYLGKNVPSVISTNPDVVVVESFGYNPYPYDAGALDRHWLQLAVIVQTLKTDLPGVKIIIAATIAPNSQVFGDGAAGLSFSATDKIQRTTVIKGYLDSTVKFAYSQHLPLADVYHASLDGNGDGIRAYINPGDHIHYSDAGRSLFAQILAGTIVDNHILE